MEVLVEICEKNKVFSCSGILFDGFILTTYCVRGMKKLSFFVSFGGKSIRAHFIKFFHSQSISDSLDIFRFFTFDKEDFLIPLFVLLKLDNIDNNYEEKFGIWLQKIPKYVEKSTKLVSVNIPFGNKFLSSHINRGIISNIVGENDCLILSDLPLTPGTEGSPIFRDTDDKSLKTPIGIVVSVSNWWKNEWLNFTIIANLRVILMELLSENFELNQNHPRTSLIDHLDSSFFQIFSGTIWGSCILLDVEKRIFLTNSHVASKNKRNFINFENNEKNPVTILYKNDELDIAILKAKNRLPEHCKSIEISKKNPKKGDLVYAVGFPFFSRPFLTITQGNIIDLNDEMMKTSCAIHPGASGGGIVNKNGELLAIIVCNAKIKFHEKCVIFPKFNLSLPYSLIRKTIKEFLENDDASILTKLNEIDVKTWEFFNSKL